MKEPVKSPHDHESEIARQEIRQGNRQVRAAFDAIEQKMEIGIDSGANRIREVVARTDEVTEQLGRKVDESIDSANLLLDGALTRLGESFVRTDQVIDRVKSVLDEGLDQAEQLAGEMRDTFARVRDRLSDALHQADALIDRAERAVDEVGNPLQALQKDPSSVLPLLIVGGMLAGMFVGRSVERRAAGKPAPGAQASGRAA